MDQQDVSGELAPVDAKVFRTCVGVLLYLAVSMWLDTLLLTAHNPR